MPYSIGQRFWEDLLHYSTENAKNDEDAIKLTYIYQKRLNNRNANNPGAVLLASQEYSGIINNKLEREPLGGPLNWRRNGIRNKPGSPMCSPDINYFKATGEKERKFDTGDIIIDEKNYEKESFENIDSIDSIDNEVLQNELIEHFTNKEEFEGGNKLNLTITIVAIIVIFLISLGIYMYY